MCDKHINTVIDKYIKLGWAKTSMFYLQRNGKQKSIKHQHRDIDDNLLKMLNAIRLYKVKRHFDCANTDGLSSFQANGSTNLTSDYDITIIGYDAPYVMNRMINNYCKTYKNTLAHALDVNIYCDSIFLYKGINRNISKFARLLKIDSGKNCLILPKTAEQQQLTIDHIMLKFHDSSPLRNELLKLNRKNNTPITNQYKLYYKYGKQLYNSLYNKSLADCRDIYDKLLQFCYYAMEGYYAPSTFCVVVLEIAKGQTDLGLTPFDYWCAALENLADFQHHILHDKLLTNKARVLKYSKYLYRIYYSLGKMGISGFLGRAKQLKLNVLPHRGNNKFDQYKLLGYLGGDINSYVKNIVDKVMLCAPKLH